MEKTIFYKFFKDITIFFLYLLIVFSLIVWIIQAVNFLDFVIEDGHGIKIYLKYTLLNLPKIISRLIPLIFFISAYVVINKYEDNNELKIFSIIGINRNELANKITKFTFSILIILLIVNVFIIPSSQNKAREFIKESNIDFFPSLIREKKFIDTVEGLTIFIEKKINNNSYENIFLKDENENDIRVIYAKKGYLINNQIERSLELESGKIIHINNKITEFDFQKTSLDLSKYITKSTTDAKLQEKNTFFLMKCFIDFKIIKINENNNKYDPIDCSISALNEIQAELYKRIIKPFFLIFIAYILSILFFSSKESFHINKIRLVVFAMGLILIIFSELLASLSSKSFLGFQISLLIPILFFVFYLCVKIYLNKKLLI